MSHLFRAAPKIALAILCLDFVSQVGALPLTDGRPAHETTQATVTQEAPDAQGFVADDNVNPTLRPPRKGASRFAEFDVIDSPAGDAMINPGDRGRRTTAKPEAVPFTHVENGLNDLAFDNPENKPWFADDKGLKDRMRGVRNRASELMDWGLHEKIDEASRELLESLGIEDSTTTRLMIAEATAKNTPQPWTAQAASRRGGGTDDALWAPESSRNLIAHIAFLIWDTLTHPITITLMLLFFGFRLMIAVVRLSTRPRKRARHSTHKQPQPAVGNSADNSLRSRSRRRIR